MKNAVGSFGLVVTCSEDAHRQICMAARGQPMSIAFYPENGVVCYGSEQAAVKVSLLFDLPGGNLPQRKASDNVATQNCRLDLDDSGCEIVLLDWGGDRPKDDLMVTVTAHQESKANTSVHDRTTPLTKQKRVLTPTPTGFKRLGPC